MRNPTKQRAFIQAPTFRKGTNGNLGYAPNIFLRAAPPAPATTLLTALTCWSSTSTGMSRSVVVPCPS